MDDTLLNPAGDTCFDCCVPPVVNCYIDFTGEPDLVHWEVSGANTAWIIKTCGSYTGTVETRIDLTLTDGGGSGTLTYEDGCGYVLHAENECGESQHSCSFTVLNCNKCFPSEQRMYGTFYEVAGAADSGSRVTEYYRISDGVLCATVTESYTGAGGANHSGFVPWNPETCCWADYSLSIPRFTRRYDVVIHVAHFNGAQTWPLPGSYFNQLEGDLYFYSNPWNCDEEPTDPASNRKLSIVQDGFTDTVETGGLSYGSYNSTSAAMTAVVVSDSLSGTSGLAVTLPLNYIGPSACFDELVSLMNGVTVNFIHLVG